jgi:hypothetical protein
MMQTSVKDVSHTFGVLRKITITTLVGAFLLNGLLVYYLLSEKDDAARKVYVVTDHGTLVALQKDSRQVSVHEARNHVRSFLSFAFAHNAANYKEHVERALQLIDKAGGARLVHDFNKGEVYPNYVRLGTHTTLQIDSVNIDMLTRPITGAAYARQNIHLDNEQKTFPIAIRFELTETYRSDKNPYGLLIGKMDYVPYTPALAKP